MARMPVINPAAAQIQPTMAPHMAVPSIHPSAGGMFAAPHMPQSMTTTPGYNANRPTAPMHPLTPRLQEPPKRTLVRKP